VDFSPAFKAGAPTGTPDKKNINTKLQSKKAMNIHVILNGAQRSDESRRPYKERFFAALRMTKNSLLSARSYESSSVGRASVPASERRPGTAAPPTPAIFHLSLCPQGNDGWYNTKFSFKRDKL
jgi:hypothetical protein